MAAPIAEQGQLYTLSGAERLKRISAVIVPFKVAQAMILISRLSIRTFGFTAAAVRPKLCALLPVAMWVLVPQARQLKWKFRALTMITMACSSFVQLTLITPD